MILHYLMQEKRKEGRNDERMKEIQTKNKTKRNKEERTWRKKGTHDEVNTVKEQNSLFSRNIIDRGVKHTENMDQQKTGQFFSECIFRLPKLSSHQ